MYETIKARVTPLVRSDALLAEALILLNRIYATWCSDGNNDEFVDALDGLMEDTKRFLEAHTTNNDLSGRR